jgi:hypothetical protein
MLGELNCFPLHFNVSIQLNILCFKIILIFYSFVGPHGTLQLLYVL